MENPADILVRELAALAGPGLPRAIERAVRRGGRRIVTRAVKDFQSRGIGRRIFHGVKGRKAARGMIKLSRPARRGDTVTTEITASGLAKIQEQGGPIKPHRIAPKVASVLAFVGPTGPAFSKGHQHPGANHPAMPSVGPAIAAETASINEDIETAVNEHIREAAKHAVL